MNHKNEGESVRSVYQYCETAAIINREWPTCADQEVPTLDYRERRRIYRNAVQGSVDKKDFRHRQK
jgi:hypothetical protein